MKNYKSIALGCALLLGMSCCLTGCTASGKTGNASKTKTEQQETIEKAETQDINDVHLRDKDSLYENDDETSVVTMYLTVSQGNSSEGTNHTWKEINSYSAYDYDKMGVDRYQTAALLQVGDESGPQSGEVGYGENVPNATVQLRHNLWITRVWRTKTVFKVPCKRNCAYTSLCQLFKTVKAAVYHTAILNCKHTRDQALLLIFHHVVKTICLTNNILVTRKGILHQTDSL